MFTIRVTLLGDLCRNTMYQKKTWHGFRIMCHLVNTKPIPTLIYTSLYTLTSHYQ